MWETPFYKLKTVSGKYIWIDVTNSVSASAPTKNTITKIIPILQKHKVQTVLDFGAGALRNTLPLLEAGFQVCAVEFEKQFEKPQCNKALLIAQKNPNFMKLTFPNDFLKDKRKFDSVFLCFVLQVMPKAEERKKLIGLLETKMKGSSILVYMSQYGQFSTNEINQYGLGDGVYRGKNRNFHTFYTEFPAEDTHSYFKKKNLERFKSLSERGTDQIYLYTKGDSKWI